MRRFRATFGIAALVLLVGAVGWSTGADLSLTGGSITLTVATAIAGAQPDVAGNTNCRLLWLTGGAEPTQKVTVRTSLSDPNYSLRVEARNVTAGTGTGIVPLSALDTDIITDIGPAAAGTCQLYYEAAATAAQGAGSESHTITYTITAQ
jgi:hypothetical protein